MLHRHARPAVAGSFLIGSLVGALTTAAGALVLAGLLSPIPTSVRTGVALAVLAGLAVHQSSLRRLRLPQHAHQIPQSVFHRAPTAAARRFAFELGTGVRTYITTAAPYGVAAVLVLSPPVGLAPALLATSLAGIGFGLGRSVIVVAHTWRAEVAVDHPRIWLLAAAWVSLAASSSVAVGALLAG